MSLLSREKGKVGEREAAAEISRLFNVQARRGQQYCGGPGSPDVVGLPGVHVEVKRAEKQRFYDWIEQAVADSMVINGESNVPLVVHRTNGREWLAVVRLDDLPRLATKLYLTLAGTA